MRRRCGRGSQLLRCPELALGVQGYRITLSTLLHFRAVGEQVPFCQLSAPENNHFLPPGNAPSSSFTIILDDAHFQPDGLVEYGVVEDFGLLLRFGFYHSAFQPAWMDLQTHSLGHGSDCHAGVARRSNRSTRAWNSTLRFPNSRGRSPDSCSG
ncbi:hypothetical protein EJ06DRAFT_22006 [Trichodelitschia bisporula]|uniref:Uncharacterized protein n=1 Tax=Trichodelitschia bisporula TaxID=703511 RepID=A0A6G1IAL9_9PEZI|nr:hypothetical protein EJ06DRAFT_22006 [Trichodelitschia bisporula]